MTVRLRITFTQRHIQLQLSTVAVAFEKVTHFLAFVLKVGVVTTEAHQSKKFRELNDIFYVLWMRVRM